MIFSYVLSKFSQINAKHSFRIPDLIAFIQMEGQATCQRERDKQRQNPQINLSIMELNNACRIRLSMRVGFSPMYLLSKSDALKTT